MFIHQGVIQPAEFHSTSTFLPFHAFRHGEFKDAEDGFCLLHVHDCICVSQAIKEMSVNIFLFVLTVVENTNTPHGLKYTYM